MTFDLKARTVCVFSHPNHELATFGLIQRLRPTLVFLTDGGGEHRINETQKGLASIGLADRAIFLPNTEQSFYDALLHVNTGFFLDVAGDLRAILKREKPEQILCDAVEYYNPVHDMTLPIVSNADDAPWDGIFEVPLIYQKPGPGESYGVQSAPAGQPGQIVVPLTETESASKRNALENTYTILRDTLGKVLLSCPDALKQETLYPASTPLRWPDPGRILRYELRAKELMARGEVPSEITHAYHFIPLAAHLTRAAEGG
jgi:LmbE family N-acetylglucosaminyl deacetylase